MTLTSIPAGDSIAARSPLGLAPAGAVSDRELSARELSASELTANELSIGAAGAKLRHGARLFLDREPSALAGPCDRLQINSGTRRLALEQPEGTKYGGTKYGGTKYEGTKYQDGIYLPREDWRAVSAMELTLLQGRGGYTPTRDIRVFTIPPWLHRLLWDLDLGSMIEDPGFSTTIRDPLFERFCVEAGSVLEALGIPSRKITVRFQKSGGGKAEGHSTTFDPEFETFVGLHVDNFERRPIDTRHLSFPRVVVNLGLEPRSFVFINLPLINLLAPSGIAHSRESYQRYSWAYPLAHRFMESVPDYPAVRLLLHPGEGYVAPTQNLIHDGYGPSGREPGEDGIDVVLSALVRAQEEAEEADIFPDSVLEVAQAGPEIRPVSI